MIDFSHGGDVEAFAQKLGCSVDEVIDLSSNIHFNSPEVTIDINSIDFKTYPKYDKLYQALAKHYDINDDELELFNGGSSAIFSLIKEFKNKDCYIYSPAYLEYKKAAQLNDKNITLINRFEDINQDIKSDSIVVFVNPSTPDGVYYDMKDLLEFWISKNSTIIVDESFLEFTQQESIVNYIDRYEKLYVLKSLTKFYGCAGIRMGIVVSNAKNIQELKKSEPLWKISHFDSLYIQQMLEDKNYKEKTLNETDEAKNYLYEILKDSNSFAYISQSSANFFLVKLKNLTATQFQKKLEPYKIMVRDCSNFDFLDESYIRIAVKSKSDLIHFSSIVKNF